MAVTFLPRLFRTAGGTTPLFENWKKLWWRKTQCYLAPERPRWLQRFPLTLIGLANGRCYLKQAGPGYRSQAAVTWRKSFSRRLRKPRKEASFWRKSFSSHFEPPHGVRNFFFRFVHIPRCWFDLSFLVRSRGSPLPPSPACSWPPIKDKSEHLDADFQPINGFCCLVCYIFEYFPDADVLHEHIHRPGVNLTTHLGPPFHWTSCFSKSCDDDNQKPEGP